MNSETICSRAWVNNKAFSLRLPSGHHSALQCRSSQSSHRAFEPSQRAFEPSQRGFDPMSQVQAAQPMQPMQAPAAAQSARPFSPAFSSPAQYQQRQAHQQARPSMSQAGPSYTFDRWSHDGSAQPEMHILVSCARDICHCCSAVLMQSKPPELPPD